MYGCQIEIILCQMQTNSGISCLAFMAVIYLLYHIKLIWYIYLFKLTFFSGSLSLCHHIHIYCLNLVFVSAN